MRIYLAHIYIIIHTDQSGSKDVGGNVISHSDSSQLIFLLIQISMGKH